MVNDNARVDTGNEIESLNAVEVVGVWVWLGCVGVVGRGYRVTGEEFPEWVKDPHNPNPIG